MNHLHPFMYVANVDFLFVLQLTFYLWAPYPDVPDWAQSARLMTYDRVIFYGEDDPVWYWGKRVMRQYDSLLLLVT